jgi:hypothetical protein
VGVYACICVHTHMHVYVCVCECVCVFVSVVIYIYIYICLYTYIGALRTLAAREELAVVEARVRGLEDGRGEILDKITREVDANRLADNERAKDVSERIEGIQRALDACVDM